MQSQKNKDSRQGINPPKNWMDIFLPREKVLYYMEQCTEHIVPKTVKYLYRTYLQRFIC